MIGMSLPSSFTYNCILTCAAIVSEEEALQILADLHGKGDKNAELVQLEYEEIKAQVHFEKTEGAKSYLDLLKPGIFRRVGLGCSLQMWSQLTGMNVMMYGFPFLRSSFSY
jgi:Sugar (and other) transporter